MPSPIAHASVAFVLWPALARDAAAAPRWKRLALAGMLVATTVGADVDFVPHLLMEAPDVWQHGGATHSIAMGVVAGTLFMLAARALVPASWLRLWIVGCLAWWSHLLLDFFTPGGGVMAFWPLMNERFVSPVPLFFGAEHSQPLAIHLHAITFLTELPFVVLMWWLGRRVARRQRECPPAATAPRQQHCNQPDA